MTGTALGVLYTGAALCAQQTRRRLGPLWSAAAVIALLTTGAKVLGLVKEMAIASHFGTSAQVDAFVLALSVPTLAINVVVGLLPMALTPAFVRERERTGAQAAHALAGTAFRRVYGIMAVLAVIVAGVSIALAHLPSSSLSPTARADVPTMALILVPFTVLQGAIAAWSGVLAACGVFALTALATAILPAATVAAIWMLADSLGILALPVGLLTGSVLQALVLARALFRQGIPLYRQGADLSEFNKQYLPAMAGALFTSGCAFIDQVMASWLPSGAVSAMSYGGRMVSVALNLAIVAIGTPVLPYLARLVEREDWSGLLAFHRRTSGVLLLCSVPAAIVLALTSGWTVALVFERGAFTATDTAQVSTVQALLMLQLPGQFVAVIAARLIAALGRNRIITALAVVNLIVNIAANLVLMRTMGVAGIALSTAIVQTLSAAMLFVACERLLTQRIADGHPTLHSA